MDFLVNVVDRSELHSFKFLKYFLRSLCVFQGVGMAHSHDAFFKKMLSHQEVAAEFVNVFVSGDFEKKIDLTSVQRFNDQWANEFLKKRSSDIVLKAKFENSDQCFYVLIEAQSKIRLDMGYKVHGYTLELHKENFRFNKEKCFDEFVWPMVFYHGVPDWLNAVPKVSYQGPGIGLSHYSFKLIQLFQCNMEQLKQHHYVCVLVGVMRCGSSRNVNFLCEITLNALRELELNHQEDIIKTVAVYLDEVIPSAQRRELRRRLNSTLREGEPLMGSIASMHRREGRQEGLQEGRQKGLQEGRQEGLQEGLHKTVKGITDHLLQKGYSWDEITHIIPHPFIEEVMN